MTDNPLPPPDISGYGKVEPLTKGVEKETTYAKPPDNQAFQSYMKEPTQTPTGEMPQGISPMDLAKTGMTAQQAPTLDSLLSQANITTGQMDAMKNNLSTPNLRFKSSQARLLESKLGDAKEHIASASGRLQAPLVPDTIIPPGSGPIAKFIGMLTDGQKQLMAAKAQVEKMKANGEELKPGDMLLVQIKLSQAQQEIEYSSILLSKIVDIIKQMINIQI